MLGLKLTRENVAPSELLETFKDKRNNKARKSEKLGLKEVFIVDNL